MPYILWIVVFYLCLILPSITLRRRRRRHYTLMQLHAKKERTLVMNEILEKMIGKQCEIITDSGIGKVAKILSIADGWLEIEDAKGVKTALNLFYVSSVKEVPEKVKK